MEISVGYVPDKMIDLATVKKHQYDVLTTEYRKAVRNNHKEVQWLGVTYPLQFAHYLIEYLNPKFKDMI